MFVIDDATLVLGIVVLLLAVVTPFVNVLMVRLKADRKSGDTDGNGNTSQASSSPGISVVITVDDEGENLKSNLPKWLSVSYAGNYQVVVVVTGNDSLVDNVLKQYRDNDRLYTTFIPSSSRYMSRKKLAITVGIKAARHDWVLLSDVDCYPSSDSMVSYLATKCEDSTDIILGYTAFESDFKTVRLFDSTYMLCSQLAKAQRGKAWGYSGNCILLRKNAFIEGKGFDGNLKYARGEYDFLANKYSSEGNTAVACSLDAMLMRQPLSKKGWRNKMLNYIAIRKSLQGAMSSRVFFNLSMWSMVLNNLCSISVLVYSVCVFCVPLQIVSLISIVISMILRMIVLSHSIRPYLDGVSYLKLWWCEQTLPFRNAVRLIRYCYTDKYDFISHKV